MDPRKNGCERMELIDLVTAGVQLSLCEHNGI
jgi:hypothetical protein